MGTSQNIVDTIIQTVVVGLFSPYSVAAAPIRVYEGPVDTSQFYHMVGSASFTGSGSSGQFKLHLPPALVDALLGTESLERDKTDLVRELINQLSGLVRNRMLQLQVELCIGTPTILDSRHRTNAKEELARRNYVFRTLRGDLVSTLEGHIDASKLVYSTSIAVGRDGDVILF